ncbi:hypothetical protein SteCoe_13187 [Stentor coeruleus]|uniref:non-specific serine/threonine protein kinase n=1 Tax=Stentor coeruleus TaxID=5963 RepID=A0A1R2C954_9CILI|nr:hypothetical protein SteCoe_13187 [Stentor coeruleus]
MGCTVARKRCISSDKISIIDTSPMQFKSKIIDNNQTSHLSDYASLSFLGVGAFGEVLSVRHIPTGTYRAQKIIKKSNFRYEDVISGVILKESLILSRLNHPNVIKFYEVLEDSYNYYIITELCEGGSLRERVNKFNQIPETMVIEIMKQILDALCYIHNKNLVHCDIKLENILLTSSSSNVIKIADFGCSQFIEPETNLNRLCGSLHYLAPEVIKNNYREKADIWSCGILALIMLTGALPYSGNNKEAIKEKIKSITTNELLEKMSQVSFEAQDFVRQMLETDPDKRITAENARKHPWLNTGV